MYQLPMLIRTRMISVPRATKSPCSQSAPRPYGLSTVSLLIGAAVIGAGAGAAAEAGSVAAGVAPAAADAGCALAVRGDKARTQRASETRAVAIRAGIWGVCRMRFFLSVDCMKSLSVRGPAVLTRACSRTGR